MIVHLNPKTQILFWLLLVCLASEMAFGCADSERVHGGFRFQRLVRHPEWNDGEDRSDFGKFLAVRDSVALLGSPSGVLLYNPMDWNAPATSVPLKGPVGQSRVFAAALNANLVAFGVADLASIDRWVETSHYSKHDLAGSPSILFNSPEVRSSNVSEDATNFGENLALSDDQLFVASREGGVLSESGVLEIYAHSNDGDSAAWVPTQMFRPLGSGIRALDAAGDVLVIGLPYYSSDRNDSDGAGAVSIASYNSGSGKWELVGWIENPEPNVYDSFGTMVKTDGQICAVGARRRGDSNLAGAVFVYFQSRSDKSWKLRGKLGPKTSAQPLGRFPTSIDVFGETVVVGAAHQNLLGNGRGCVYIYDFRVKETGDIVATQVLTHSEGSLGFSFGTSVALSGDLLLVGTANTANVQSAHVSVFVRDK